MIFTSRVWEILSYDNNAFDVTLNYIALAVSFVPVIQLLSPLKRRSMNGKFFWVPLTVYLSAFQVHTWILLYEFYYYCMRLNWLFSFLLQIILCLFDGCVGISIIWCSYCGFSVVAYQNLSKDPVVKQEYSKRRFLKPIYNLSLTYCGVVCMYYAMAEEPITTVAHACAVVMGGLIGYVFSSYQ